MATWGKLKQDGVTWHDLEGVTWGALEDFCTINPKTKQIPDDMEVSFVPMQRVSDTGDVQTDEIRKASEVKKGFTFFEEGDVLFAKITPCMENGKGGIARGLKNGVGFGSTEFHVLHPDPEKVSSEWLYFLTSWDEFRKQCARNMTGSAGQKRVPKSYLEHYKIHLPSLEEQRRIAALLDKVSDLITKRRAQLDKLDLLVKARFVEMFGDPINNSKKLPTILLGEACSLKAGITTAADTIHDQSEEYPIPCYGGNGIRGFVKEATQQGSYPIIGRQGALCGNVQLATGKFHATEHAVLVSPLIETNVLWIYYLLRFMNLYRYHTGAAQPGLAVKTLNEVEIPLAKIDQQNRFAIFVEQIDKSKLMIQQSLDKLETLKKALMQQYFG